MQIRFKAINSKNFFDRAKIEKEMNRKDRTVQRIMGFRVRQTARKLLKVVPYKKDKGFAARYKRTGRLVYGEKAVAAVENGTAVAEVQAEAVGGPPKARTKDGLRLIFYSYETSERQTIVGPIKFQSGPSVPALHEMGGTVVTRRGRARYPKRPFMKPSLDKHLSDLPELWATVK